jgi:hypothetical protein
MANIISKVLTSIFRNRRTYTVKWSNGKKTYDTYTVRDGRERPLFMGMTHPPKEPRV